MAEYVTQDELSKYGKKSVANAGMTLGIIGTALGVLNGGFGNILGGNANGMVSPISGDGLNGPTPWEAYKKECADAIELTKGVYDMRIVDLKEKFEMYKLLDDKISALACKDAQLEAALPLTFQLAQVNSERYADNKVCADRERQAAINTAFQTEIMLRPVGKVALPFSDLITGVPQMPKIIYQTQNCGCGCGSDSSVG